RMVEGDRADAARVLRMRLQPGVWGIGRTVQNQRPRPTPATKGIVRAARQSADRTEGLALVPYLLQRLFADIGGDKGAAEEATGIDIAGDGYGADIVARATPVIGVGDGLRFGAQMGAEGINYARLAVRAFGEHLQRRVVLVERGHQLFQMSLSRSN